jgi:hypothetical protein
MRFEYFNLNESRMKVYKEEQIRSYMTLFSICLLLHNYILCLLQYIQVHNIIGKNPQNFLNCGSCDSAALKNGISVISETVISMKR